MERIRGFIQRFKSNNKTDKNFQPAKTANANTVRRYGRYQIASSPASKQIFSTVDPAFNKRSSPLDQANIKKVSAQRKYSLTWQQALNKINPSSAESQKKQITGFIQPSVSVGSSPDQENHFPYFERIILQADNLAELERITHKIDRHSSLNHLTSFQTQKLKALILIRKNELASKQKNHLKNDISRKISSLKTLEDIVSFKQLLIKRRVSGALTPPQGAHLQNQLIQKLYFIAQDREQARRMTIELLKSLTGDYLQAKKIQQIAIKVTGYTPHKDVLQFQERLYRLRNDYK